MNTRLLGLLLVLCACLLYVPDESNAAVIGGNVTTAGKTFQFIAPPANVGNNNQQDNNTLYAFDEKQSILLLSDLTVNVSPGGGSAVIPAGTWVSSHYVFFDPSSNVVIDGTVDFSDEVLGIMTDLNELNASDFLGIDTTSYNSPSLRGLESVDSASISGVNQITVHLEAGSPGDYVRVITLPEPASVLLLLPLLAASLHCRTPRLA